MNYPMRKNGLRKAVNNYIRLEKSSSSISAMIDGWWDCCYNEVSKDEIRNENVYSFYITDYYYGVSLMNGYDEAGYKGYVCYKCHGNKKIKNDNICTVCNGTGWKK